VSTHPNLPDALVHFTDRPRGSDEEVPDFAQGSAEEKLVLPIFPEAAHTGRPLLLPVAGAVQVRLL